MHHSTIRARHNCVGSTVFASVSVLVDDLPPAKAAAHSLAILLWTDVGSKISLSRL